MGGNNCSVSRECKSNRFIETIHGIGGEHSRAGTTGWTSFLFNCHKFILGYGIISSHNHGINQVVFFSADSAGLHRSSRNKHSRDIQTHCCH